MAAAPSVQPGIASAQTEAHFQYGNLLDPFSGKSAGSWVLTLQHASFWSHGDNFFFVDFLTMPDADGHDVQDVWMEWYSNFSLRALTGAAPGSGALRDIGFLPGVNIGADPNHLSFLPGARLAWNMPGFIFLNTDVSVAVDRSAGIAGGGAPATDPRFYFDMNGAAAFEFEGLNFMLAGHWEYAGATTNELGEEVPAWLLAQPQLTVDVGELAGTGGSLSVGIEYQYWRNKLGTTDTESVPQFLVVWRF